MKMIDNNIKWIREELEMTQTEFAKIFGVTWNAVAGWENAYFSIPMMKLAKLCNLYNYSLDYVMGLTRKNTQYGTFKIDKTIISQRLKELRKKLNLSQSKLSDDCKIARTTYIGYESGKNLISTTNLCYICKTYNVSMDYIVGRTKNTKIN